MILVDRFVDPGLCENWANALENAEFESGSKTAGWLARTAKDNEQLPRNTLFKEIQEHVQRQVFSNGAVNRFARPAKMGPMRVSRYVPGMSYGNHNDDPLMQGPMGIIRTDISFTLFLAPPGTYEGGTLRIHNAGEIKEVKLEAGQAVFYPSGALHEVTEITQGQRLAVVGWIESRLSDPRQREILGDLEATRANIFEKHGANEDVLLLSKSIANLMRLWATS
ncbi:MAG: Fe2+-dependent dioxygenase [Alphaproteobacteria bacterium]